MPLEAMGKLDEFSEVFDLDVYRKNSHKNKVMIMASYKKEGFATDNVDFLISFLFYHRKLSLSQRPG